MLVCKRIQQVCLLVRTPTVLYNRLMFHNKVCLNSSSVLVSSTVSHVYCNMIRPIVCFITPAFGHMLWFSKTGLSWIQIPVHQKHGHHSISVNRWGMLVDYSSCLQTAIRRRKGARRWWPHSGQRLLRTLLGKPLRTLLCTWNGISLSLFCQWLCMEAIKIWFFFTFKCLFSVTQQNVSSFSLWVFRCLPFFSSLLSSTCPMGMIACMWMLPSSRPSGVWPLSAQEARLHKVDIFLVNKQTFWVEIQFSKQPTF